MADAYLAYFSPAQRAGFRRFLRTVESPGWNLLLGGRAVRFSALGHEAREAYLLSWANSRIGAKRSGFQAVKRLAMFLYYTDGLGAPGGPESLEIGYDYRAPAALANDHAPQPVVRSETAEGIRELTADVCVVGSGAGGALIAAYLARAGHKVVVLEAGPFRSSGSFPATEGAAYAEVVEGRGLLATGNLGFQILAGRGAGGSTTINWMTSLPPPKPVRLEWQERFGLEGIATPEFDGFVNEVQRRLHVQVEESVRNPANDVLWSGCTRLGYAAGMDFEVIPRNSLGCNGRCDGCTFGCRFEAKQSALNTYLVDALRAGARLICDAQADRVLVHDGRAVGVEASVGLPETRRPLTVRAPTVVVSAGAIQTPALLLRSGLRLPGVGHHLHLHPTTALFGEFAHPIRMWDGPMQTVVVRRFQNDDPVLHGPWIEAAPAHPGLSALGLPWLGGLAHRERMARLAHASATIALVRDVGEGRIEIDAQGRPAISYRLHSRDRANLVHGIIEAARINLAAGAVRIGSLHQDPCEISAEAGGASSGAFDRFAEKVRRLGIRENRLLLFSAHPTGTARLGSETSDATGKPTGEVRGVDNLWIGDGSALPSAPGVNPMITIMSLARGTAGFIEARVRSLRRAV